MEDIKNKLTFKERVENQLEKIQDKIQKKENFLILKIEVKNINNGVAAINEFFKSHKLKMMENCELAGGVIELPRIYAAVRENHIQDLKKVLVRTGSKFTTLKSTSLDKNEIDKILIRYKIKDSIVQKYKKEFPPIKHIKETTAVTINLLNSRNGYVVSINKIKEQYLQAGQKIDGNNNSGKEDIQQFKELKEIVDDLKSAQLIQKEEQLKEQNTLEKSNNLEMTQ